MMYKHFLILGVVWKLVLSADRRITVTDRECGRTYNAEDETLLFIYRGEELTDECVFTIKKYSDKYKMICVVFDKFMLKSCQTTIEYRPSPNTVKTHDCETNSFPDFCKELQQLTIVFKNNGTRSSDEADLKVYYKEEASGSIYVGSIAMLAVAIICCLVAAAVFYKKRRERAKKEKKEKKKREKMEKELKETGNV